MRMRGIGDWRGLIILLILLVLLLPLLLANDRRVLIVFTYHYYEVVGGRGWQTACQIRRGEVMKIYGVFIGVAVTIIAMYTLSLTISDSQTLRLQIVTSASMIVPRVAPPLPSTPLPLANKNAKITFM